MSDRQKKSEGRRIMASGGGFRLTKGGKFQYRWESSRRKFQWITWARIVMFDGEAKMIFKKGKRDALWNEEAMQFAVVCLRHRRRRIYHGPSMLEGDLSS